MPRTFYHTEMCEIAKSTTTVLDALASLELCKVQHYAKWEIIQDTTLRTTLCTVDSAKIQNVQNYAKFESVKVSTSQHLFDLRILQLVGLV